MTKYRWNKIKDIFVLYSKITFFGTSRGFSIIPTLMWSVILIIISTYQMYFNFLNSGKVGWVQISTKCVQKNWYTVDGVLVNPVKPWCFFWAITHVEAHISSLVSTSFSDLHPLFDIKDEGSCSRPCSWRCNISSWLLLCCQNVSKFVHKS